MKTKLLNNYDHKPTILTSLIIDKNLFNLVSNQILHKNKTCVWNFSKNSLLNINIYIQVTNLILR